MVVFVEFLVQFIVPAFGHSFVDWLWRIWRKPTGNNLCVPTATLIDICSSKRELILENALLRQQLIVLHRQVNRPQFTNADRALLVLLAGKLRTWKSALLIVQPDTVLRSLPLRCGNPGHRQGFRLLWKRKSRPNSHKPMIPAETVELIKQMASENRLWGAERIRGELIKLDIRVCKRTIQKHMTQVHTSGPINRKPNQNWRTFVRNHASQIWAADFLPVYDLFFRPLFIFFILEPGTRRVVRFGVTRFPTDEWTSQQLREATPFGDVPRFLIRDNYSKYGQKFACVGVSSGIEVLRTPYKAPRANAFCERFLGSVRRECLDHVFILGERHLHSIIKEYVKYYNSSRPHQGIGQRIPYGAPAALSKKQAPPASGEAGEKIISFPVLEGLHHDYRRAA